MIIVKGKITFQIWASDKKNFFVYIFIDDENIKYKIKTNNELYLNKSYELSLEKILHTKYGETWNVIDFKLIDPENKNDIILYFSSSLFNGIGKKVANKIYDKWGDNSIKLLKKDPKLIFELSSSIKMKKAQIIFDVLNLNSIEFSIKDFFILNNISINIYNKINTFLNIIHEWENIKENPYFILEKFYDDFDFLEIDKIALALGFAKNNLNRLFFVILEKIATKILNNTNTYFIKSDISKIYNLVVKDVFITKERFYEIWKLMFKNNFLIYIQDKDVYSPFFLFEKEKNITEKLLLVKENKFDKTKISLPKHLNKEQKDAIKISLKNNLSIITGAPGTGKSEILKYLIDNLKNVFDKQKIVVLTPTGKASIKLKKDNEFDVKTIHSFLQSEKFEDRFIIKNALKKDVEVLVIDEFSMVDLKIFNNLLNSLNILKLKKIILIGDKDQISAIGYGNLLADFINSKIFKISYLIKNYRQKDKIGIINDSQKINESIFPDFTTNESRFISVNDNNFWTLLNQNIDNILTKYSINEIIILATIYKGEKGINQINDFMQNKIFRNNKEYFLINNKKFFIGDRVIQNENNIEENVMNGEIGYIKNIATYKGEIKFIHIEFENEKNVKYNENDFIKYLNLAYCISVHKFQGSEAKVVIFSTINEYDFIFNKKIIYTAMTRAQELLIVFGQEHKFEKYIQKNEEEKRSNFSYLFKKLKNN
ncbi:AAA family ATPase [[Mycoplasma] collis]|uniref:AAA family ATPase n=1 Tax=[Mycoplasma] collis TaxID=2127 RepID=UPI00068ED9DC|nr:AAA family ATPase [[Mycoplasma] collis]